MRRLNCKISNREIQVLELISLELTTKDIADRLILSDNTIKTHKKNLFIKLEAKNAAGLIRRAFEYGLLSA